MRPYWIVLLFGLVLLQACGNDAPGESAEPPVISLDVESARYKVKAGRDLTIVPTYQHVDSRTTYSWTMDSQVIGNEPTYTFNQSTIGDYFITLVVTNSAGSAQEELKVSVVAPDAPFITLYTPEGGYKVASGQELQLSPEVENASTSTFQWSVNGKAESMEKDFTFKQSTIGTYTVKFTARNADGEDSVELTINVCTPSELPFSWKFQQTVYNVAEGRSVKVKAYFIENDFDATYIWRLNGETVSEGNATEYIFKGEKQGTYTLSLTMKNEYAEQTQQFTLNVCPPEGTYYRATTASSKPMVNKVYEYMPAPGHQVNGYKYGASFPDGCTMEQACDHILNNVWNKMYNISLGSCGGYVVAGFDHSVDNSGGDWDLLIKGNPYGYQSEPGIVWVSQDVNGNGLPDDQWYELAGSEYGTTNSTYEYAITYYRPTAKASSVKWTDNQGKSGTVPYMSDWNTKDYYWQEWVPTDANNSHTYYGTQLRDRSTYENGVSTIPPYDWGYADNESSVDYFSEPKLGVAVGHFKLSNAKTFDHQDANLRYIDFVKVQTGQIGYTPNLGDISTEVHYISDYHLDDISLHPTE